MKGERVPSPLPDDREDRILIVLSVVIGVLVGLVVVAFVLLTGRLSARMYPAGGAPWRRLLIPAGGSLITGYLLYRFFPDARGSGIPQTKAAIVINQGYLSLRTVLGKFFCCSASLASGIALGREGPSVHIGAGIASVLARRFGLSDTSVKAMVPAGCAAALAAAFNTPIAAVLFSLEEILGDLHAPVLGSVVLSSATSWMVLHLLLGDEPLFHVPAYQLLKPSEFGFYAILGVVGGLASVLFVKLLLWIRLMFKRLPRNTVWLQPVAGGITVGVLGWFFPDVLGVGYDFVDRVLGGDTALQVVVLMCGLKMVATAMCYSSGNAGGIFGPSLFIGAMVGGAVGSVVHSLFPQTTATPGAYALVGMGTAFAGIIRTPLTSVIMIFELTRDYSIIVPLMISNLISFFISRTLQPEPIYEALAHQDGIFLPSGKGGTDNREVLVETVMQPPPENLPPDPAAGQEPGGENVPYVYPDHAVSYALQRMGSAGLDAISVVSRANRKDVRGVVTLKGILEAFGLSDGSRDPKP